MYNVVREIVRKKFGKIKKKYSGIVREAFTEADNFGISCNYKKKREKMGITRP